jgi:hypothetical protein
MPIAGVSAVNATATNRFFTPPAPAKNESNARTFNRVTITFQDHPAQICEKKSLVETITWQPKANVNLSTRLVRLQSMSSFLRLLHRLVSKLDPNGRMVAGMFPATDVLVHLGF